MNTPHQVYTSSWNRARVYAWFRDLQHRLDVMSAATILNIDGRALGQFVTQHTEASAQAGYWKSLDDTSDLVLPTGGSDHSVASAFEVNYFGSFRSIYLVATFGPNVARKIIGLHRDFNITHIVSEYNPSMY